MAASWLLISMFHSVFEPTMPDFAPLGKQSASRVVVASASPLLAHPFHRLTLQEGAFWFSKGGNIGPFLPSLAPTQALLWLGSGALVPAPIDLACAWQFRLRAASNPRAPCLS